jgi:hypothetical protein
VPLLLSFLFATGGALRSAKIQVTDCYKDISLEVTLPRARDSVAK